MYRTIHRYDTIHTIRTYVSDDSWALTIHPYDETFCIQYDTYRISYDTENCVYIYISKLHSQKYINFVKMPLLRTNFLGTSDWFNKQILYEESPYKETIIANQLFRDIRLVQ